MEHRGSASSVSSTRQLRAKVNNETIVEVPKLRTGLVYEEHMMETRHQWLPDHADRPERIQVCYNRARELGLVDRCIKIPARYATEKEVGELHSAGLLEDMRRSETAEESDLLQLSEKYGTHFDRAAFRCALLAAGCALNLVDAVLSNQCHNGMAIIRPPGHHASADKASGYCFFNNAAIAAHRAITKYDLRRVLILDWDVHHGQGTQHLFYNSRDVFYISIHRYEYAGFWPYLREGDWDFIGAGKGRGYNVNIPLNKTGLGDPDYLAIFQQLILPLIRDYNPELIIVSAGYDAAIGDPEGKMLVSPACFAHLTHSVRQFAGGKICVVLEGGYCLKALAESAAMTLRDLLGEPCPSLPSGALLPCHPVASRILLLLMRALRPYWPNTFVYQGKTASDEPHWKNWLEAFCKRRTSARYSDEYRPTFDLWTPDQNTGYQNPEVVAELDQLVNNALFVPRPLSKYARLLLLVSNEDALLLHRNMQDPGHPESPDRVICIANRLKETKIMSHVLQEDGTLLIRKSRPASREELLTVHQPQHVDQIFQLAEMSAADVEAWASDQNSLYACPQSLTSALHAVGGLIDAVDVVMTGQAATAFATIRPPGHHSDEFGSSGFCLFNNVAVAANVARKKYGLKRIVIVDFDIHFGDGTTDPHVLYISLHRYDHGRFFPGKKEGDFDMVGVGEGIGYNVNIPWSSGKMGVTEYMAAFERVIMPICYEYNPELVLISAGFDAAAGDPLGNYTLTPEAFGSMTHMLSILADGHCVVALEGGYSLNCVADGSEQCCRALLGLMPAFNISLPDKPLQSAVDILCQVLDIQSEYWKCLAPFRVSLPGDNGSIPNEQPVPASVKRGTKGSRRQTPLPNVPVVAVTPAVVKPTMQTPVIPSSTGNSRQLDENALTEAFQRVAITSDVSPPHTVSQNVATALGLSTPKLPSSVGGGIEEATGFLVQVRDTCPHVETGSSAVCCRKVTDLPDGLRDDASCDSCGDHLEGWICLACFHVGCSRYRNSHALEHFVQTGRRHAMAMGLADLSLWCFSCEQYIEPRKAGAMYTSLYHQRFGTDPPDMG